MIPPIGFITNPALLVLVIFIFVGYHSIISFSVLIFTLAIYTLDSWGILSSIFEQ